MLNPNQKEALVLVARQVKRGEMSQKHGAAQLNARFDINENSAFILLGVYNALTAGELFKFHPSISDLEFLMSNIGVEADGRDLADLDAAIKALQLHIDYRTRNNIAQDGNRRILDDAIRRYQESAGIMEHISIVHKDLMSIVMDLNKQSVGYRIGELHRLRKKIKQQGRMALAQGIFHADTVDPAGNWAFHYGGRTEIQFNIGKEEVSANLHLRYGVAFSLEPSQTLPDISKLYPLIGRYNEFMRLYGEKFNGFRLWYWDGSKRSDFLTHLQIGPEMVRKGRFIFLGKYIPWKDYTAREVLRTFDQLLPLYEFVESREAIEPLEIVGPAKFAFRPNTFEPVAVSTQYTAMQRTIDVTLRHTAIQKALFNRLCEQYGKDNVVCEISSGVGVRVDVLVKQEEKYWFYEVKTHTTARACIREAIGQLLEYSFWPGAQQASRIIVIGEPPLDHTAQTYLKTLESKFMLPISYEQQSVPIEEETTSVNSCQWNQL